MENNLLVACIVHLVSVFFVLGGIFNWDFFYRDRRAQILIKLISRTGARIFYGLSGALLLYGYYAIIVRGPW